MSVSAMMQSCNANLWLQLCQTCQISFACSETPYAIFICFND